ncbi:hypothetical protein CTI14_39440, partial [Methylobacterium radiotolerans]
MASVLAGLDHIQLPVADLAASIAWYERLLGFRVLTDYGSSAMLRAEGGPDLMLWEAPGHAPMKLTVSGEERPLFFLRTTEIHALAERFAAEGVEVVELRRRRLRPLPEVLRPGRHPARTHPARRL